MKHRVLIFDRDPAILDTLLLLLEDEGYEVSTSVALYEDVALISAFQPDIILLGAETLHSGEGIASLRTLKASPCTASLPVVLLTTNSHLVDQQVLQFPQDRVTVVAKPFDVDDLLQIILQALLAPNEKEEGEHPCFLPANIL